MSRVVVLCPGRGSYTEASLGSLDPDHEFVRAAERRRADFGLEPLLVLDQANRFEPARHLRPAHVSPLIFVKAMIDGAKAAHEHDVVAIGGNSMGWYIGLCLAGALSFEDGFRLVQQMSMLQEEYAEGGQVIYPVVSDDWRPAPDLASNIDAALASSAGEAMPSIDLGGYRVLAGSKKGVSHLLSMLPQVRMGNVTYPIRLAQHGPYHTVLAEPVAEAARAAFADLKFHAPHTTLIDGRGRRFTPWSTDLAELKSYTLGAQVTTPYDFTASVRVALREFAPDHVILPGPGNTLGGIVGQILAAEGWRGIHSKADFQEVQRHVAEDTGPGVGAPFLVSMGMIPESRP
ncbi:Malonyl CoA-acyl carrier protein transacylase [Planctomycetes bacterium Poly30]|uniref:[acyl-carrier-protein] S-malonyltransferase n=1 Tax=Saltatorellus ferox TaxID=2528018 RepID=A0A518ENA2_9BACT|nr:Malonyl CoA-acyl carrier protein transacylase [Planctomycetes bacterium Poly30]